MDTTFTVSFGSQEDEALCASSSVACFARIDEIERLLTKFSDTSDVAVVRAIPSGGVAVVSCELMDVLVASVKVCSATGGAFDPTVEARSFGELILDVDNFRVGVKNAPVALDFGGIAKGYALDECAKILRSEQYELSNWLLDGGTSTLFASGSRTPEEEGWPVGVGGVWKERTKMPTVVRLSGGALSGSGFELRGEHVRDVRRGGAAVRWAQSWSRADSAVVADALSTAALSLDSREIRHACRELGAKVLVARHQRCFMDKFRDPLLGFNW